ncbi:FKBP-type peptidyl-prolyl cis-trans isomerase FklB [Minicystis rosea]|nr:FKBP-type peptidyl-prolyl cis-trans isomerase FklB [Minicystis rosea]
MTMMNRCRTPLAAALLMGVGALMDGCGVAPNREQSEAISTTVSDIELSYKRDPRMVDPFRGLGPWVGGPGYSGATAQSSVEARARAVDSKGQPVLVSPRWIPSDPGMVTVSPGQGDQVTIAVHRAGESRLEISAEGFSKALVVRAKQEGEFLVLEIAPPPPVSSSAAAGINPALKERRQQVSYAVGLNLAKTLQKQSVEVDPELVRKAFTDVLSGGTPLMSEEQAHLALIGVETEINVTEAALERRRLAEKNQKDGDDFLAENRKKEGVVALPSGLQYKVITLGTGRKPTLEDVAVCHYRGMFLDGKEFDSSYRKKTHEPVPFPVNGVIAGWQEALQLMPAGSKWQLFVPSSLAYGERGAPRSKIGSNTTLMFEVELLSVEPRGARPQQPGSRVQKARRRRE